MPSGEHRRRRLNRLALFAFAAIVVIVSLEAAGWGYVTLVLQKSPRPKFRFNSYRIYEHVPGFRENDGTKDWLIINAQGFRRSSDTEKRKPATTIRIFLLGGSAAHGTSSEAPYPIVHIDQTETIDAYLETMLAARHPRYRFEVINAAVTGYQVFQHTAYILSELLDYQPDAMIFIDGANDHYISNPGYDYYAQFPYQFWLTRLQAPTLVNIVDYTLHWATRFSTFARGYEAWRLRQQASESSNPDRHPPMHLAESAQRVIEGHARAAKKSFLRSIETNLAILRASNVKAVIALQPQLALRQVALLSANERDLPRFPDPPVSGNVAVLHPIVALELHELTSKYDAPFVDLNIAFNDRSSAGRQLFIDYVHLTPRGSALVAETLLPVVEHLLFGNPAKR